MAKSGFFIKKKNWLAKRKQGIKLLLLFIGIGYFATLFVANIFYYKNDITEKSFLPKISFGIDIVGGHQMTIAIDDSDVVKDFNDKTFEVLRIFCNDKKIDCNIHNSSTGNFSIQITTDNSTQSKINKSILRELQQSLPEYQIKLNNKANDKFFIEISLQKKHIDKILATTADKAISILKSRIDGVGVKEISVQRYGMDKIVVLVPRGVDISRIKKIINTTAKLDFHLMDRTHIFNYKPNEIAKHKLLLPSYYKNNETLYLVDDRISISGDCLSNVQPAIDGINNAINFRMNSNCAKKFGNITKNNIGRLLAIVFDGKVLMAPMINVAILNGAGSITGHFTASEASDLSVLLSSGALPAKISIINEKQLNSIFEKNVLSKVAIVASISFVIIGLILIARYRVLGSIASLALIFNFLFTFGIISIFGLTLTLPGIAGFILMLGMACDANILIYEKIRELKKQGVTNKETLVKNSFTKAIGTILDANITTIIAGIALFGFGSSFIKGFSITLIFGILCSIFTSVNITKMIIEIIFLRKKSANII